MNKIALSLLALAALSTASYAAGNRSWDLRDGQYYNTSGIAVPAGSSFFAMSEPLAVASDSGTAMSAFERTTLRAIERNQGDR